MASISICLNYELSVLHISDRHPMEGERSSRFDIIVILDHTITIYYNKNIPCLHFNEINHGINEDGNEVIHGG